MTSTTAARSRRTARMTTVILAAVIVALLAFMGVTGALTGGTLTAGKLWPAVSLLTIVVVTAVVGLVVAGHQPRNPIGWLLAGEAVFILLSVASGAYANLVYRLGYHDLAFGGPLALVLSQLFNFLLVGFPLVILLFPDGRLPSRRWRPVLGTYLAITAAALLATSTAVLILVAGHHVDYQASWNLASLGHWGTAWAVPVQVVFLITVGAFWLAAITRQALSWRRSDGERRYEFGQFPGSMMCVGMTGWAAIMMAVSRASPWADWRVRGSYFEACNCEAICPCRSVGGRPGGSSSSGECFGALSWHIHHGHADGVGLSGLRAVMSLRYFDRVQRKRIKVVGYLTVEAEGEASRPGDVRCGIPGFDHPGTELHGSELRSTDPALRWEVRGRRHAAFATDFDYRSDG